MANYTARPLYPGREPRHPLNIRLILSQSGPGLGVVEKRIIDLLLLHGIRTADFTARSLVTVQSAALRPSVATN